MQAKLPTVYKRKSTSKNKPTFEHIYYDFFSALVNNSSKHLEVMKTDIKEAMYTWVDNGLYLKNFDNKRKFSYAYLQQELLLFQDYFSSSTFGHFINKIFFKGGACTTKTKKTVTTPFTQTTVITVVKHKKRAPGHNIISKIIKKNGLAYSIHCDKLKAFLINSKNYNDKYEDEEVKTSLSQVFPIPGCSTRDNVYNEFFKSLSQSQTQNKKIKGSDLFKAIKDFTRQLREQKGDDRETIKQMDEHLNITRFGMDMNRLLIAKGLAEKNYTNAGTIYTIYMDKLPSP